MKKKDQAPQQTLVERQPLTGSRKIYVPGKLHPNIRVAMREIVLADTERKFDFGFPSEQNAPVTVYDTSGPYTDPNVEIDLKKGLPRLREAVDSGPRRRGAAAGTTSEYGQQRAADASARPPALRAHCGPATRQAGLQREPDALRQKGHHHARNGVHRHPRKPALRRAARRSTRCAASTAATASGPTRRRATSRPNLCARK